MGGSTSGESGLTAGSCIKAEAGRSAIAGGAIGVVRLLEKGAILSGAGMGVLGCDPV